MNKEEYTEYNDGLNFPDYEVVADASNQVDAFIVEMRSLVSGISSFDTQGLDLGGTDYGLNNIKSNLNSFASEDSDISEIRESLKQTVLQLYGMEKYIELYKDDDDAKVYKELLESVTQDDYFAYVDRCDNVIEEYSGQLSSKLQEIKKLDKMVSVEWENQTGLTYKEYCATATTENAKEMRQLEAETAELAKAINFIKQFKEYYYVQAYGMYLNETDFSEMSISRIDHYEERVAFGLAQVSENIDKALAWLHECGYAEERLPKNYTEDDVWNLYNQVSTPWVEDRYIVYFDKDGNEIEATSLEVATYLYQTGQKDNYSLLYDKYADGLGVKEYYDSFKHLTSNEISILQYLERTGQTDRFASWNNYTLDLSNHRTGAEQAEEVFDEIEAIYARIGKIQVRVPRGQGYYETRDYNEADALTDINLLLYGEGFVDGLKTFAEGIDNLSHADGRVSVREYKASYLLGYLENKFEDDKFARVLSKASYEIFSSVGNMAPSIAASLIIGGIGTGLMGVSATRAGQAVGLTLMGLSATGNSREQGLQMGLSDGGAWLYGVLSGMSEVGLDMPSVV